MRSNIVPKFLAWTQKDPENRLGFRGGRYTSVNNFSAVILAVVLSLLTYAIMIFAIKPMQSLQFISNAFLRPDNLLTLIPATLFFYWGMAVLFFKRGKLNFQSKALELEAIPNEPDFILNETTAHEALQRINGLVDHPRHFVLLNRIDRALSSLRNIGQINDVSSILRAQAENDEDQVASSYTVVHGLVWAIPVLGFIGTVQGLSMAMGGFGKTLQASGADMEAIRTSLQGVAGGLATGFETTLVALLYALILQLGITFQQQKEMSFLDECNDYCHSRVVSKLRLFTQPQPEYSSEENTDTETPAET